MTKQIYIAQSLRFPCDICVATGSDFSQKNDGSSYSIKVVCQPLCNQNGRGGGVGGALYSPVSIPRQQRSSSTLLLISYLLMRRQRRKKTGVKICSLFSFWAQFECLRLFFFSSDILHVASTRDNKGLLRDGDSIFKASHLVAVVLEIEYNLPTVYLRQ